jgi:type III secretion protein R
MAIDPISLFIVLMAMAFLPFVAMVVTSYTKIVVVLGLLRNAIGVQQVPPNTVINGIALIVSCYVIAPFFNEAYDLHKSKAPEPTAARQLLSVIETGREPYRKFLTRHAKPREVAFFMRTAHALWPAAQAAQITERDLIVLAPAFALSELTEAFKIGFMLYLVFVVVDIVTANVLLAMGLSQVQPGNIAIPLKLLLFVLLDGWSALIHGLVMTYR